MSLVNLKLLSIQAWFLNTEPSPEQEPHHADRQVSSCIQKLFFPGLIISKGVEDERSVCERKKERKKEPLIIS